MFVILLKQILLLLLKHMFLIFFLLECPCIGSNSGCSQNVFRCIGFISDSSVVSQMLAVEIVFSGQKMTWTTGCGYS